MTPLVLKGTINWTSIRQRLYEGLRQTGRQDYWNFSLKKAQNFHYFVIDSPWPLLITDKNFRIVYANPAWEKLTKYYLSEVLGKSLLFFIHKRNSDFITRTILQGKNFKTENLLNRRKDGKEFQTHSIFFSVKQRAQVLYYVQISHDITLQKKHEEVFSRFKSIVHSSNDAIFNLDSKLNILSVNPAAERMYGYSKGELIGKSMMLIIPENKKHEIKELYKEVDGNIINYETDRQKKDGSFITVAVTNSPIFNQRHKLIGYSAIHRDITEKRKLDEQKKLFLSAASHELKTPITTLKLLLQIHKKKLDENLVQGHAGQEIDAVDRELNHLTELINDLLDVSRFETGKFILNLEEVNLTKLIQSTVKKIRLLYKVKIKTFIEGDFMVIADRARVEQVITNLLTNAIKHAKSELPIEVTMTQNKRNYIISVKDFGAGIPKLKQSHVFEQFYQGGSNTQGFGLGLFICRNIIDLHHGKISVKSRPDQGSIFTFTLPRRKIN